MESEKRTAKEQLERCKQMEKGFVGKSKINVGPRGLFSDELPSVIDGIEIFKVEDEEHVEEESEIEYGTA